MGIRMIMQFLGPKMYDFSFLTSENFQLHSIAHVICIMSVSEKKFEFLEFVVLTKLKHSIISPLCLL